jgi:hypothetical protein
MVSFLTYSLTLKMEVTSAGEMVGFQWTTWYYIPREDHYCENLRSHIVHLRMVLRMRK